MKRLIFIATIFSMTGTNAQVPFATYEKQEFKEINASFTSKNAGERIKAYEAKIRSIDSIKKADYFDHANANIVVIQDAKKMFPTVNGEIINYRLGIWTRKIYTEKKKAKDCKDVYKKSEKQNSDKVRLNECLKALEGDPRIHNLPFSIISKVSGNYMDSAAGPTNDATSFFGAPLTFRISPAFDLMPGNFNNKLFFGINADIRLLIIGDEAKENIETGWGTYASAGFTYLGKGYAFENNDEEPERHNGKWSFSAMLYWFKSGGTFNKAVFGNYEKKELTGLEMMLRFKASKKEDSKFNFILSASNGFTAGAPNFGKWDFRIGVGK